jgi:hypothetical protein
MNLDKLKSDLDELKKTKDAVNIGMNRIPEGAAKKTGRQAFLGELIASVNHNVPTQAVQVLNAINETVEATRGSVGKSNAKWTPPALNNNAVGVNQPQQLNVAPSQFRQNLSEGERDKAFEDRLASIGKNQTLADTLQNVVNHGQTVVPNQIQKPIYEQYTAAVPQSSYYQQSQAPTMVSEQVNNLVNEAIGKNLNHLVEHAFKSVLTDIFANQRINTLIKEYVQTAEFENLIHRAFVNAAEKRKKLNESKK